MGCCLFVFFFQAEDGIRDWSPSRGLGDVYKRQVLTGMKAVGKYDVLHGLVANPQPNPQCTESNEKLDALYQQAIPLAVRLIEAYAGTLDTDTPLDKAYDHTFGEF